jgi:phage terminase small subunit
MRRGRPPIPTKIHLIRGTYRKDRHARRGDAPRVFKTDAAISERQQLLLQMMPAEFDTLQREAYESAVRCGPWLQPIDFGLLKCYSTCFGIFAAASVELGKRLADPEFANPKSEVHKAGKAYASIVDRHTSLLFKLADELLLTPQSRARYGVELQEPEPESPWAKFRPIDGGKRDGLPPTS